MTRRYVELRQSILRDERNHGVDHTLVLLMEKGMRVLDALLECAVHQLAQLAAQHGMDYRCIGYTELLAQQQQFLRRMGQP